MQLSLFNTLLTVLFCIILLVASQVQAEDKSIANLFEQANLSHTRGEYQQAIDQYLAIAGNHGVSAPLLYNLANSYAANDQPGQAVVNYKRALRLSPGDADIQANLEQVRKDAGLYRDDKPFYERIAGLLQADQWLMLSGAAFLILAVTALVANLINQISPGQTRWLIFSSLLIMVTCLPTALFNYQAWNDGVVTGEDSRLLISPFAEAASSGSIKAGRLIRPGKTHGEFVLIRDETGLSGWLSRDSFLLIGALPNG